MADTTFKRDDDVIGYSVGPLTASVCALAILTPEEVVTEFNRTNHPGTANGWKLSEDKTFLHGQPNPCPCDQYPTYRKHYLLSC